MKSGTTSSSTISFTVQPVKKPALPCSWCSAPASGVAARTPGGAQSVPSTAMSDFIRGVPPSSCSAPVAAAVRASSILLRSTLYVDRAKFCVAGKVAAPTDIALNDKATYIVMAPGLRDTLITTAEQLRSVCGKQQANDKKGTDDEQFTQLRQSAYQLVHYCHQLLSDCCFSGPTDAGFPLIPATVVDDAALSALVQLAGDMWRSIEGEHSLLENKTSEGSTIRPSNAVVVTQLVGLLYQCSGAVRQLFNQQPSCTWLEIDTITPRLPPLSAIKNAGNDTDEARQHHGGGSVADVAFGLKLYAANTAGAKTSTSGGTGGHISPAFMELAQQYHEACRLAAVLQANFDANFGPYSSAVPPSPSVLHLGGFERGAKAPWSDAIIRFQASPEVTSSALTRMSDGSLSTELHRVFVSLCLKVAGFAGEGTSGKQEGCEGTAAPTGAHDQSNRVATVLSLLLDAITKAERSPDALEWCIGAAIVIVGEAQHCGKAVKDGHGAAGRDHIAAMDPNATLLAARCLSAVVRVWRGSLQQPVLPGTLKHASCMQYRARRLGRLSLALLRLVSVELPNFGVNCRSTRMGAVACETANGSSTGGDSLAEVTSAVISEVYDAAQFVATTMCCDMGLLGDDKAVLRVITCLLDLASAEHLPWATGATLRASLLDAVAPALLHTNVQRLLEHPEKHAHGGITTTDVRSLSRALLRFVSLCAGESPIINNVASTDAIAACMLFHNHTDSTTMTTTTTYLKRGLRRSQSQTMQRTLAQVAPIIASCFVRDLPWVVQQKEVDDGSSDHQPPMAASLYFFLLGTSQSSTFGPGHFLAAVRQQFAQLSSPITAAAQDALVFRANHPGHYRQETIAPKKSSSMQPTAAAVASAGTGFSSSSTQPSGDELLANISLSIRSWLQRSILEGTEVSDDDAHCSSKLMSSVKLCLTEQAVLLDCDDDGVILASREIVHLLAQHLLVQLDAAVAVLCPVDDLDGVKAVSRPPAAELHSMSTNSPFPNVRTLAAVVCEQCSHVLSVVTTALREERDAEQLVDIIRRTVGVMRQVAAFEHSPVAQQDVVGGTAPVPVILAVDTLSEVVNVLLQRVGLLSGSADLAALVQSLMIQSPKAETPSEQHDGSPRRYLSPPPVALSLIDTILADRHNVVHLEFATGLIDLVTNAADALKTRETEDHRHVEQELVAGKNKKQKVKQWDLLSQRVAGYRQDSRRRALDGIRAFSDRLAEERRLIGGAVVEYAAQLIKAAVQRNSAPSDTHDAATRDLLNVLQVVYSLFSVVGQPQQGSMPSSAVLRSLDGVTAGDSSNPASVSASAGASALKSFLVDSLVVYCGKHPVTSVEAHISALCSWLQALGITAAEVSQHIGVLAHATTNNVGLVFGGIATQQRLCDLFADVGELSGRIAQRHGNDGSGSNHGSPPVVDGRVTDMLGKLAVLFSRVTPLMLRELPVFRSNFTDASWHGLKTHLRVSAAVVMGAPQSTANGEQYSLFANSSRVALKTMRRVVETWIVTYASVRPFSVGVTPGGDKKKEASAIVTRAQEHDLVSECRPDFTAALRTDVQAALDGPSSTVQLSHADRSLFRFFLVSSSSVESSSELGCIDSTELLVGLSAFPQYYCTLLLPWQRSLRQEGFGQQEGRTTTDGTREDMKDSVLAKEVAPAALQLVKWLLSTLIGLVQQPKAAEVLPSSTSGTTQSGQIKADSKGRGSAKDSTGKKKKGKAGKKKVDRREAREVVESALFPVDSTQGTLGNRSSQAEQVTSPVTAAPRAANTQRELLAASAEHPVGVAMATLKYLPALLAAVCLQRSTKDDGSESVTTPGSARRGHAITDAVNEVGLLFSAVIATKPWARAKHPGAAMHGSLARWLLGSTVSDTANNTTTSGSQIREESSVHSVAGTDNSRNSNTAAAGAEVLLLGEDDIFDTFYSLVAALDRACMDGAHQGGNATGSIVSKLPRRLRRFAIERALDSQSSSTRQHVAAGVAIDGQRCLHYYLRLEVLEVVVRSHSLELEAASTLPTSYELRQTVFAEAVTRCLARQVENAGGADAFRKLVDERVSEQKQHLTDNADTLETDCVLDLLGLEKLKRRVVEYVSDASCAPTHATNSSTPVGTEPTVAGSAVLVKLLDAVANHLIHKADLLPRSHSDAAASAAGRALYHQERQAGKLRKETEREERQRKREEAERVAEIERQEADIRAVRKKELQEKKAEERRARKELQKLAERENKDAAAGNSEQEAKRVIERWRYAMLRRLTQMNVEHAVARQLAATWVKENGDSLLADEKEKVGLLREGTKSSKLLQEHRDTQIGQGLKILLQPWVQRPPPKVDGFPSLSENTTTTATTNGDRGDTSHHHPATSSPGHRRESPAGHAAHGQTQPPSNNAGHTSHSVKEQVDAGTEVAPMHQFWLMPEELERVEEGEREEKVKQDVMHYTDAVRSQPKQGADDGEPVGGLLGDGEGDDDDELSTEPPAVSWVEHEYVSLSTLPAVWATPIAAFHNTFSAIGNDVQNDVVSSWYSLVQSMRPISMASDSPAVGLLQRHRMIAVVAERVSSSSGGGGSASSYRRIGFHSSSRRCFYTVTLLGLLGFHCVITLEKARAANRGQPPLWASSVGIYDKFKEFNPDDEQHYGTDGDEREDEEEFFDPRYATRRQRLHRHAHVEKPHEGESEELPESDEEEEEEEEEDESDEEWAERAREHIVRRGWGGHAGVRPAHGEDAEDNILMELDYF